MKTQPTLSNQPPAYRRYEQLERVLYICELLQQLRGRTSTLKTLHREVCLRIHNVTQSILHKTAGEIVLGNN
jgi:hypothetical protein